MSHCKFNRC